jgi:hypothetical protein
LLAEASPLTLNRLLGLYPISSLKEKWPKHGNKEDTLTWIVRNIDLREIIAFLDGHFSCCKQHINLFTHQNDVKNLPNFRLPSAEKVADITEGDNRRLLYIAEVEYHVVFTEPLREDKITFLWPICLEFSKGLLAVRFVKMEKHASAYFEEPSKTLSRSLSEVMVLRHLHTVLSSLKILDINKGIKHLWDNDKFDGVIAKFAKSASIQTESMHPGKGFKQNYPDLYRTLHSAPLGPGAFRVSKSAELSFASFSSDPTGGTISFSTYSEIQGDTDRFVAEIIKSNK